MRSLTPLNMGHPMPTDTPAAPVGFATVTVDVPSRTRFPPPLEGASYVDTSLNLWLWVGMAVVLSRRFRPAM